MKFIQKFVDLCRDEAGAVTVEYVALAVVVVALGAAGINVITTEVAGEAATVF